MKLDLLVLSLKELNQLQKDVADATIDIESRKMRKGIAELDAGISEEDMHIVWENRQLH
jgi:hypothetical protein